jgi:hypothetical protein
MNAKKLFLSKTKELKELSKSRGAEVKSFISKEDAAQIFRKNL